MDVDKKNDGRLAKAADHGRDWHSAPKADLPAGALDWGTELEHITAAPDSGSSIGRNWRSPLTAMRHHACHPMLWSWEIALPRNIGRGTGVGTSCCLVMGTRSKEQSAVLVPAQRAGWFQTCIALSHRKCVQVRLPHTLD